MAIVKWVIVVGSVGEINTTIGAFDSEEQAESALELLESNWYSNGERYTGEVLPMNEWVD